MKKVIVLLSIVCVLPAFSFDFKAQKDKLANKAKGHAEEMKRDVQAVPGDILASCKSEMENTVACKGNTTPDTIKTCLIAHKEQLSQGCKASLGL